VIVFGGDALMKCYAGSVLAFGLACSGYAHAAMPVHAWLDQGQVSTLAVSPASLIAALTSSSIQTRSQAAADLVTLDAKALPAILAALDGSNALVPGSQGHPLLRSDYLAWVLANIPSDPAPALLHWCQAGPPPADPPFGVSDIVTAPGKVDPSPQQVLAQPVDRWALTALILAERHDGTTLLRDLIDNKDPLVSRWAIKTLGSFGPPTELFDTLARRVERGPDAAIAMGAIGAMSSVDPKPLRGWLDHHPDPVVRTIAASALIDDGPETLVALSGALENDQDEDVRAAVIANFWERTELPDAAIDAIAVQLAKEPDEADDLLALLEASDPKDTVLARHAPGILAAIKASNNPSSYAHVLRRLAPFLDGAQEQLVTEAEAMARAEDYDQASDSLALAAIISTVDKPLDLRRANKVIAAFPLSDRGAIYAAAASGEATNLAPLIIGDFRKGLKASDVTP
jgi:hypothetical protein